MAKDFGCEPSLSTSDDPWAPYPENCGAMGINNRSGHYDIFRMELKEGPMSGCVSATDVHALKTWRCIRKCSAAWKAAGRQS